MPSRDQLSSEDNALDSLESDGEYERLESKKRRAAAHRYLESLKQTGQLGNTLKTGTKDSKAKNQPEDEESDEGEGEGEEIDAAEVDRENIAHRLKLDIRQSQGKTFRYLASSFARSNNNSNEFTDIGYRVHKAVRNRAVPTCISLNQAEGLLAVGFKSGDVGVWSMDDNQLHSFFPAADKRKSKSSPTGHTGHVLCVAISPDSRFIVSGGSDGRIFVWKSNQTKESSQESNDNNNNHDDDDGANSIDDNLSHIPKPHSVLSSHRGPITCLSFVKGQESTTTLFTASLDRTIKIWNLNESAAYVDTLFGHQDQILSLDALSSDRCVSVGARDRTVRLWKIPEETQLVFRASSTTSTTQDDNNNNKGDVDTPSLSTVEDLGGSLEAVVLIDGNHFVSGSDAGTLCLWSTHRKKPIFTLPRAHTGSITTLYLPSLSDLLVSGGEDGRVKLWQIHVDNYNEGVTLLMDIPLAGIVNGLAMDVEKRRLIVALGREGRLGRWKVDKTAKNQILTLDLP